MAYELIAFDMDGTLLDSHKEVLRSSVDAISEAVAAGKRVAIASGRCPRMVSMYRESIPGVRYAICCAGAIVFDLAANRVLSEVDIAPEVVARAIHTADEEGDYVLEVTTGLGIAMANAPDNVKAAADVIAPVCDEDGAAWAMEKYLL